MTTDRLATGSTGAVPAPATNPWLRRALVANLALEVLIVVTGGTVRVTGSGLGCPTWPRCTPDSFVPVAGQAEGFHRFIEYGNRMLTPIVSLAALGVVVAVWRLAPERRALRRLSVLPLAGVVLQALIGGLTVRMRLSPAVVSLHFLASMVLVTLSTYLLVRAGEGDGPPDPLVRREVRWLAGLAAVVLAVVLVLGTIVTGTGPHSGDADTRRYDLDPRIVSWVHADGVMLFLGLAAAVWLGVRLSDASRGSDLAWRWVLGLALAQGLIGFVQYATNLPEALVVTHLLGASLLVVAMTNAQLSLRHRSSDGPPGSRSVAR